MALVMNETDVPELIDDLRENLHLKLAEHDATTAGKSKEAFTPGIAISEETLVNQHNSDDSDGHHQDSTSLKPGEIPQTPLTEPPPCPVQRRTENLPNGRSGQAYKISLGEVIGDLPPQLVLEDDGGTGMTLSEERQLQGTPTAAGSVQIQLSGLDSQGEPVLDLTLKLALIPSSRDLWKDLSSDPDAPYAKPDVEVDRLAIGEGWHMAMGSQRGRSHAHRGGQRDDHGVIARTASGWNLLLVGDGAGSCDFSRQGSLLATTKARDALVEAVEGDSGIKLEETVLAWWTGGDHSLMPQELVMTIQSTVITSVHQGHLAIRNESKASGHPLKAFSTTLLLALHKETLQGHVVITFGIGDGGIAALTDGSQATLMNNADSGQHVGQTRFLDAPLFQEGQSLYQRVKVRVFDSLDALILATDGVTDPKFESENDMRESASWWALYDELAPALSAPVTEESRDPLLEYLNFFIERHHDDRTVAVLYRESQESASDVASLVLTSADVDAATPEATSELPTQSAEPSTTSKLEQKGEKDE
ncbi:protein phosphatase 2C domain-containing protein [Halomonas sp. 11-S5]|uniref:protein phosphatase 2C domain-containing protein n=1 Tax=Halomonas sp. 11-S5 TaxID=2994064 RepID=UPI002468D5BC|nr:protein phosphatase 2C domain-containing protein [Halomonas sp. 11-S5]